MAEADPSSVEVALRIGVALHRGGDLDRAREVYAGVLQVAPEQPDALQFSGILEFQSGNREEGLERVRRALDIAPERAGIWSNLGNMLKLGGDLERAEEAYARAITLAPDLVDAHCNLGVVRRARGDKSGAMQAFQRALALKGGHGESLHNLGNVHASLRQWEQAIGCYRQVVSGDAEADLKTRNLSAEALIRALASSGRRGDIEAVLQSWHEWDADNPVAAHLLAAYTARDVPARASDDYLRNLFDTFAGSFDEVLKDLEYRAPELVLRVVEERVLSERAPDAVLDAGCGTGLAGTLLAPHVGHLTGVDISSAMIEKAAARGVYDELLSAEMTQYLEEQPERFDLIVAVDALVYFGVLENVLAAAGSALTQGGWLIFTIERYRGTEPFRLDISGRYQHARDYVLDELAHAGFGAVRCDEVLLRLEGGQPVQGLLVSGRRLQEARA